VIERSDKELSEEDRKLAGVYSERFKRIDDLMVLAANALALADKLL
jgi:hypothetical protein